MIDKITVYEDHLEVHLQSDIDALLQSTREENVVNFNSGIENSEKCRIVQRSRNQKDKVFDVNVISGGDPLEIYTDRDGEVIFKKYSPMGEMGAVSAELAEALARTAGMSCAICDRDAVIAAAGGVKKDILERSISSELEQLMERRECYERGADEQQRCLSPRRTAARWLRRRRSLQTAVSAAVSRLSAKKRTKRRMRCCSSCVSRRRSFYPNALQCERSVLYMHRHDHKEREPKAFPQYDDAAHIDSAAVAELPPWEQTREPKGDPKATAYTEKYCEEQHK